MTRRPGKRFWRQGEPFVWATGGALSVVLLLVAVLVFVVLSQGLGVFWPSPIEQLTLTDGTKLLGQYIDKRTNPDTGEVSLQYKTANREIADQRQDFRWIPQEAIAGRDTPADVLVLERVENGDLFGFLEGVSTPTLDAAAVGNEPQSQFVSALDAVHRRHRQEIEPITASLYEINASLRRLKEDEWKLTYREKQKEARGATIAAALTDLADVRAGQRELTRQSDQLAARQRELESALRRNLVQLRLASGNVYDVPLVNIVQWCKPNAMGAWAKTGHYLAKLRELFWDNPRESNTEGGLFPAIFGTVILVFLMSISSFPLGVLAGIYLGEYAREGMFVRLVRIAVNNLAGIPSIVYGIFGLGFFVYGLGGAIDRWLYPERLAAGETTFGTGGILWASLTLGLLTVPVVIVATEESLRMIPRSYREGSYALGATKLQTLLRVLLPMASPGMMTGFILAMARAAGEVAPLMITGVVKLAPALPADGQFPYVHLERKFMHLGFHIYDIAFQSPNVEASKPMVFVTATLLVLIVLVMSSAAIWLRNRMKKRYQFRTI